MPVTNTKPGKLQVIIFGAGIAGCACALKLVEIGISCAIIDKAPVNAVIPDYGETLPPNAIQELIQLISKPDLHTIGKECYGVQSSWGNDDIETRTFTSSIPAYGLRINKSKLVALLRKKLSKQIDIYFDVQIIDLNISQTSCSPCVSFHRNGKRLTTLSGNFFVDATGRSRVIGRRFSSIQHYDRLIASVADTFYHSESLPDISHEMSFVEAVKSGWWYTAASLADRRVVIRFSDAQEGIAKKIKHMSCFHAQLKETRWLYQLVIPQTDRVLPGKIINVPATSTKLKVCAANHWAAIGDAARTVDPLSSHGMYNAIKDGIELAQEIKKGGTIDPRNSFMEALEQNYFDYLEQRDAIYSQEQRWTTASFWQLRRP